MLRGMQMLALTVWLCKTDFAHDEGSLGYFYHSKKERGQQKRPGRISITANTLLTGPRSIIAAGKRIRGVDDLQW